MDAKLDPMATWMRRLKLRHLEVLLAIAEAGSLTAAAETLGASQPSVSQWLAEIEAALGARLYQRGRQLRPTAFLDPVLWHARRMVNDSRRLQKEITAIRAGSVGIVRIGAMHVGGPRVVPQAILRIKAERPEMQVHLVEDIAAGLWPRFDRNELDVLITRLDARAYDSGAQCETLYVDSHCVVAGLQHPLLRKRRLAWSDAATFPWILPPARTALRRAIEATFIAEGLAPPPAWLESVAMTANQAILNQTECLAVVSTGVAHHLKLTRAAAPLRLQLTTDMGPVGMVWREVEPAPVIRRALDAIRHVGAQIGRAD